MLSARRGTLLIPLTDTHHLRYDLVFPTKVLYSYSFALFCIVLHVSATDTCHISPWLNKLSEEFALNFALNFAENLVIQIKSWLIWYREFLVMSYGFIALKQKLNLHSEKLTKSNSKKKEVKLKAMSKLYSLIFLTRTAPFITHMHHEDRHWIRSILRS